MSSRFQNEAPWMGARFVASIGEPWNFVSQSGEGRIEGKLGELYEDRDGHEFLTMEILPFVEAGQDILWLLGTKRHKDKLSLRASVERRENVTLNMYYMKGGGNVISEFNASGNRFSSIGSFSFIVGTIREYFY